MKDFNSEIYTLGFNHGYILKKYSNPLFKLLFKLLKEDSYKEGVIAASKELTIEKHSEEIERVNELKNLRNNLQKDNELEL